MSKKRDQWLKMLAKIQKERMKSDLSLIEDGAKYVFKNEREWSIIITEEQFNEIYEEMEWVVAKKEKTAEALNVKVNQVAFGPKEISKETKVYIGKWNMEIFQKVKNFPNIKILYESFPDTIIFMKEVETDPSIGSLKEAMKKFNNRFSFLGYVQHVLNSTKFSQEKKTYKLVSFTAKQLGIKTDPKMLTKVTAIFKKAQELGLKLCPNEAGVYARLCYSGLGRFNIAMIQLVRETSNWHPNSIFFSPGSIFKLESESNSPCSGNPIYLGSTDEKYCDEKTRFIFCF